MMIQIKFHQQNQVCLFVFFLFQKIIILSSGIDRLAVDDHAAMAIDFEGEGLIFPKLSAIQILNLFSINIQSNN
jgi:hypothetical protein